MTEGIWVAIVGAISSVLGGLGVKIYEKRKETQLKSQATKHRNRLHNILIVYKAIEDMVAHGSADRAILFIGSNGGSRPRPGHVYQVSAVHAACNKEATETILEKFRIVRVDAQYVEILLTLLDSKDCVKYSDTTLMPEGRLKDIYSAENVKSAQIYYLGHSEEELYFCSVASFSSNLETAKSKTAIALAIDVMRHSFNLYSIRET